MLGSRERTGAGVVTFTAENNPTPAPREGRLLVAGRVVPVQQAGVGCTYDVPATVEVPGAGGPHAVLVATQAGCPITASDPPDLTDFIDVLEPDQVAQIVPLQVLPNRSSLARTGTVVVAGLTVTVPSGHRLMGVTRHSSNVVRFATPTEPTQMWRRLRN